MTETYALSQVAKASGMSPRTLQFWTSNGVIQPDADTLHGGPGTHRRYPREEVEIAAILFEMAAFNIQVGTLKNVAEDLRKSRDAGPEFGFASGEEALKAAYEDDVLAVRKELGTENARACGLPEFPEGDPIYKPRERWRLIFWGALQEARKGKGDTAIFMNKDSNELLRLGVLTQTKRLSDLKEPIDKLFGMTSGLFVNIGAVFQRVARALDD